MGRTYTMDCPICRYHLTYYGGTGMTPYISSQGYEKVKEDIKNLKYGKELKDFLEEHPDDGTFSTKTVYVQCQKCYKIAQVKDMSGYLPTSDEKTAEVIEYLGKRKSKEEIPKILQQCKENPAYGGMYTRVLEYKHICPKCHGEMKRFEWEPGSKERLRCPRCKIGRLKASDVPHGYWD